MSQKSFLLTVKTIIQETQDTTTFVFDPSPYLLDYQAGQFITLVMTIDKEKLHRSYSLCTSPYTDACPAITIKRVPGGKVSNYLNDQIKVGDRLEAFPPQGNFTLPNLSTPYKAVCVAGGSGITPIFSLIKTLLYQHAHSTVLLIYASRNEENIIYADLLKELAAIYQARIRVVHILSRPSHKWQGLSGRLTSERLKELLKNTSYDTNTHYFLCGPEGLMDLASTTLLDRGINPTHIYQEKFTISSRQPLPSSTPSKLTIYYEGEKHVCDIAPGQTLLEVALENGIDIPFACNSGMCNACKAKCLQGKVTMLENEGLDEEELEQGYVLTCVSYPTTDETIIEVE